MFQPSGDSFDPEKLEEKLASIYNRWKQCCRAYRKVKALSVEVLPFPEPEQFLSVYKDVERDVLKHIVDYNIRASGYDTNKLVAYFAKHLNHNFPGQFCISSLYFSHLLRLDENPRALGQIEIIKIPNPREVCDNLVLFLDNQGALAACRI